MKMEDYITVEARRGQRPQSSDLIQEKELGVKKKKNNKTLYDLPDWQGETEAHRAVHLRAALRQRH